jgi:hypothetical protein
LPELLRQAALDAVNSWVERPSVLNVSAVEMETTINVIFKLERPQDQYWTRLGFVSAGWSPIRLQPDFGGKMGFCTYGW